MIRAHVKDSVNGLFMAFTFKRDFLTTLCKGIN